ncbi:MAG: SCO1664 family protein [Actinomycetota bacterium]
MATEVSSERILSLLSRGTLEPVGLLPGASNDTFLATIAEEGLETYAVYKPRDGEAPLWDFPDGSLYRREMAAYVVSEALGWELVPPTVIRDGPMGVGMVQLFVDHEPTEHYLTLAEAHADVFRRVAAFDLAVNNADRKSGHCLLQRGTGRIYVVDHGVTFNVQPKLRTVIWEHAGEAIPAEILADLAQLASTLAAGDVRTLMDELLAPEELDALETRIAALMQHAVYPEPGPGRPYPWPPI